MLHALGLMGVPELSGARELVHVRKLALLLAAALLVVGCGTKAQTPATDTGPGDDAGDATGDVTDQDAATDDVLDAIDELNPPDTSPDAVKQDIVPDIAPDVPCLASNGCCNQDSDCASTINAKCQTSSCVNHTCGAPVLKSGANVCCVDSDCASQLGQLASCNTDTATCNYKIDPNYCATKSFPLAKVGFESVGNLQGFTTKVATTATGSTVAWQVSPSRSHSGKSSLYFGNECGNYDTSATAATSCQPTGASAKVVGTLTSPEIIIPKDNNGQLLPAILHYWVWIQAEPMFLTGNSSLAGTSCTSCAINQTCVNLGTGLKDTCLTEKDALNVTVNGSPTLAWSSTEIGKSTDMTKNGGWEHRVINLAGFGSNVSVTWTFDTIDGVANDFEGVYIDDVTVETVCATTNTTPPVTTTCDKSTACATSANPCAINDCTFYDNVTDQGYCFGDLTQGCCAGVADCDDGNNCSIDSCNLPAGAATGLCSNVPNAANAQCCLESNLFSDGFENGISAWNYVGSNSKTVGWQVNPTGGVGGSKSLVFTDATFQSYADPNMAGKGPMATICSPEVQLQTGTLYDTAKFKLALITEWCGQTTYQNPPGSLSACQSDTDCTTAGENCNLVIGKCALAPFLDKLTVTFKTGGQYCGVNPITNQTVCNQIVSNIATPLWSSDQIKGCNDGNYAEINLSLDKFAGKKGRVCFTFDAGDSSGNNFSGPSIDDFSMDIKCTLTQCTVDADCDATATGCKPIVEAVGCDLSANKCVCNPTNACDPNATGTALATQCDDGDSCTVDTCVQSACAHALTAGCCSAKTQIDNESFEETNGVSLPTGWVASFATAAVSITGDPYDTTMKWHVSADNFYGATGQYSMYFGNTLGNYDAGSTKVPYGLVTTPKQTIPLNGTSILAFHLNLSTEWDSPAVFAIPMIGGQPFAVDRLRVGFADVNDPTNITWAWSSYDIGGTTNSQWVTITVQVPTALAGKDVQISWEFDAGNPKNNNHIGPYVDDVSLWTTCTAPTCIADAACLPPGTPDPCKSYLCSFDEPNKAFSCSTPFFAGPGCCQPSTPLPAVTFESGTTLLPMTGSCSPGKLVNWQPVPHTYLNGKYEAYMGNPLKKNYDDPVAGCGPVVCDLDTPVLKMDANPKQTAQLQFAIWADIEQPVNGFQTEHYQVTVKHGSAVDVLWDATDPVAGLKPTQFKSKQNIVLPLAKYAGLNIVIEFHFDSGDCSLNNVYEGIYMDDIQVTEPCTQ